MKNERVVYLVDKEDFSLKLIEFQSLVEEDKFWLYESDMELIGHYRATLDAYLNDDHVWQIDNEDDV